MVKKWIEAIRDNPRCSPVGPTALGRLSDLIEDRLPVVYAAIRHSDLISQGSGMASTIIPNTLLNGYKPTIMAKRLVIPLDTS